MSYLGSDEISGLTLEQVNDRVEKLSQSLLAGGVIPMSLQGGLGGGGVEGDSGGPASSSLITPEVMGLLSSAVPSGDPNDITSLLVQLIMNLSSTSNTPDPAALLGVTEGAIPGANNGLTLGVPPNSLNTLNSSGGLLEGASYFSLLGGTGGCLPTQGPDVSHCIVGRQTDLVVEGMTGLVAPTSSISSSSCKLLQKDVRLS